MTPKPGAGSSSWALRLPLLFVLASLLLLAVPFTTRSSPAAGRAAAALLERLRLTPAPGARAAPSPVPQPPQRQRQQQQLCAIYNGVWYHFDVVAGLAWAFQEAGCTTSVYMMESARGLQRVLEPWLQGKVRPHEQMEADLALYDLVVMVTFPEASAYYIEKQNRLLLSRKPHQRFLLTVHNPRWLLEAAGPLVPPLLLAQVLPHAQPQPLRGGTPASVDAGEASGAGGQRQDRGSAAAVPEAAPQPVQLLALAPCGAAYSKSLFESWAEGLRDSSPELQYIQPRLEVPWIVPLVPWGPSHQNGGGGGGDTDAAGPAGQVEGKGGAEHVWPLRHLCIQGSIEPKRRDYEGAFAAASHPAVLDQLRQRKEKLLLVGSQKNATLTPPEKLKPFVEMMTDLEYEEYYETLSRCRTLITAFGSDMYIINKTSSTMAVALQVGTPVVTEDRVLGAYEYVPPAAAFVYEPPAGAEPRDPATLAAQEGEVLARAMRKAFTAGKKKRGTRKALRRRLVESTGEQEQEQEEEEAELAGVLKSAAAAVEMAEDEGEEDRGLEAKDPGRKRQGPEQQQQQQAKEQQKRQQQGQAHLQQRGAQGGAAPGDEDGQGQQQEGEEAGAQQTKQPEPGSFAAALLLAFDDGAVRAAHAAAWAAKQAAMQRNAEVAGQVLRDTATWADAVQAG